MTEPIDVLLHALHLCEDKFTKMELQSKFNDQLDEDIKKHSDMIKVYFEKLKQNFLQNSETFLLNTYQSQVNMMMVKSKKSVVMLPPSTAGAASQNRQTQQQTQKNNILNLNTTPAFDMATFSPLYQCVLGSIESLLEHFFMTGQYK
jgi:hypothetical protein